MKLVTDQSGARPVVWEWLHARTRLPWSSDLRCIGTMRNDGTISAAVGYNCWTENACWMHVAFDTEHSITRKLWQAAFEYPFIQCGKGAVYGMTPKHFTEALAMNERLGFRKVAETIDCVMFEMLADECRWLKGVKDGRQRISTESA